MLAYAKPRSLISLVLAHLLPLLGDKCKHSSDGQGTTVTNLCTLNVPRTGQGFLKLPSALRMCIML